MDHPCDPWVARSRWDRVSSIYQKWLPPCLLLIAVLWLGLVFLFKFTHPPIGLYIGLLALVAAVVTIWPPDSNWSKAAWLAVFFCLTGLEIRTLYQDRADNEAAKRAEDDRFANILKQNQKQFEATIERADQIQKKTEVAADLAKKNLDNITGRRSVAYIAPQPFEPDGRVPLAVVNSGEFPLTGVTVVIIDQTKIPFVTYPIVSVGTLASHVVRKIDSNILPLPGDTPPGMASFEINIYAQNGTARQLLQFRRGHRAIWDYRSTLRFEVPSPTSMIPQSIEPRSEVIPNLSYGWLEDRKP